MSNDVERVGHFPASYVENLKAALRSASCPDPRCSGGSIINTGPDPQDDPCEWCYGRHLLLEEWERSSENPANYPAPSLVDAVALAAKTFRHYEHLHREKGTPDGERKAHGNAVLAEQMEAALGSASNGLSPKEKMAADTGPLTVAALIAADDAPVVACPSDTPRTDAFLDSIERVRVEYKVIGLMGFARNLERELGSAPKRQIPAEVETRLMGWVAEDDDTDVTTWLSSDYTVSQAKEDVHALLYGVEPKVGDQP